MTGLSNTFICVMGIGTVFIGLICIVLICKLMSIVIKGFAKTEGNVAPTSVSKTAATPTAPMLNPAEKSAVVAGICACIAEELGTEASNIKVVSFRKV